MNSIPASINLNNNGVSVSSGDEHENEQMNETEICCLIEDGNKCRRNAGNASFSKRIQKTVLTRRLKLTIDTYVG